MGVASLAAPMLSAETAFHRLSVEDVRRRVEVGVLREGDRMELIDGVRPPSTAALVVEQMGTEVAASQVDVSALLG